MKKTDDNQIRARLASNDSSALEMIWNQYSTDLLAYLIGIMCSRFDAEDALQEVFITIAKKRHQLANARNLKAYLFRMAYNKAVNHIKQHSRRREQLEKKAEWLIFTPKDDGEDDRSIQVTTALAALLEKQRVILTLKFFQDKTFRVYRFGGSSMNLADLNMGKLIDPFLGEPLLYSVTDAGFTIHSVGANLVDDEGVQTKDSKKGDIVWKFVESEKAKEN